MVLTAARSVVADFEQYCLSVSAWGAGYVPSSDEAEEKNDEEEDDGTEVALKSLFGPDTSTGDAMSEEVERQVRKARFRGCHCPC